KRDHIYHTALKKKKIPFPEKNYLGNAAIFNPPVHAFVVHRTTVEDHSVKHSVDQVANSSGKNHRHWDQQIIGGDALLFPFHEKINHPSDKEKSDDHQKIFPQ